MYIKWQGLEKILDYRSGRTVTNPDRQHDIQHMRSGKIFSFMHFYLLTID